MAYLDNNGLLYLWNKIKSTFVKQVSGKGLSTNDYTTAEKTKLGGIETGANKYVHPTGDGDKHVPATGTSNSGKFLMAGSTAGTLSWGTPPNTTYSVATPSANGLMSSTDKTKLNGIAAGAEVNQNAYSTIIVGSDSIHAYSKESDLELVAGSNVTLTLNKAPNGFNNKVTIAAKDTTYTHPSYTAKASGLYKVTVDGTGHVSAATAVSKSDITKLGIPEKDTIYNTFMGANGTYPGSFGLVPTPLANHDAAVLCGNGNWEIPKLELTSRKELSAVAYYGLKLSIGDSISKELELPNVNSEAAGLMSHISYNKLEALPTAATLESTYAKKSDIVGMYKYKGSVTDASKLPTTGQITGDVYNIETASAYGGAGMNVAWNGSAWDPLGEIFTITSITNAQIDTICV